jgi:hypothetical protein
MRLISIDVGIYNLAFCVLVANHAATDACSGSSIEAWELVSLRKAPLSDTVAELHALLKSTPVLSAADQVLIERQAGLNKKMVVMSHALQMFYLGRGIPVAFCDPKAKLRVFAGKQEPPKLPSDKYVRTKALSRWHVRACLQEHDKNKRWLEVLDSNKKTDDLCDSLAQGLTWLQQRWKHVVL